MINISDIFVSIYNIKLAIGTYLWGALVLSVLAIC